MPANLENSAVATGLEKINFHSDPKEKKESEVAQLCPTLCDPMDCSLPCSSIHGIFQQEYWSELPFLSPEDLPESGIEPGSPTL